MKDSNQKKRIRIAHLQLLPLITCVQKVTLDILTHLDRNYYEPFIICQSPGPLSQVAEKHGIECLFVSHLVRPISPYHDLLALWQLTRLLKQHQFDILHTHSSKTGLLGRLAGKLSGVPVVIHTVHGFAFPASILKPGGIALIFVPSRNAWYARLNLIIPQGFKQKLLYTIYPHTKKLQGFKSYYNRCTPKDFYALANEQGLLVQDERFYFISSYTFPSSFLPTCFGEYGFWDFISFVENKWRKHFLWR